MKIHISTKIRDKLITSLKIHSILKHAWNYSSFDTKIFMSVKMNFIDFIVNIITYKKGKINIFSSICKKTYFFIYDMKRTKLRQFPDLEIFGIDNLHVSTRDALASLKFQAQRGK